MATMLATSFKLIDQPWCDNLEVTNGKNTLVQNHLA
jgi:hypothetical protein